MNTNLLTRTIKKQTPCGNLYITICDDPFRIFLNLGKTGACAFAHIKTIESLLNAIGKPSLEIIKSLKGINCHQGGGSSCIDELGTTLEETFLSHQPLNEQK